MLLGLGMVKSGATVAALANSCVPMRIERPDSPFGVLSGKRNCPVSMPEPSKKTSLAPSAGVGERHRSLRRKPGHPLTVLAETDLDLNEFNVIVAKGAGHQLINLHLVKVGFSPGSSQNPGAHPGQAQDYHQSRYS